MHQPKLFAFSDAKEKIKCRVLQIKDKDIGLHYEDKDKDIGLHYEDKDKDEDKR